MIHPEPTYVRERREEKRRNQVRIGEGVKIATTAGYGLIGGSYGPLLLPKGEVATLAPFAGIVGLLFLVLALIYAPTGKAENAA